MQHSYGSAADAKNNCVSLAGVRPLAPPMARMVPTIILTYMPPSDAFPNPMVLGHAAENGAQQMHLLPGEAWVVQVYLGAHGQFTFG